MVITTKQEISQMINILETQAAYRSLGPLGFVRRFCESLGLENKNGVRHIDADGNRIVKDPLLRPNQVSLSMLAESLFGSRAAFERSLRQDSPGQVDLYEAGGTAVVPSQFANISAFTSVATGLLDAKILETWNRPEFIADRLCENIPSNKRSEKFIGISDIGDESEERKPGNPHPRAQLSERYVETPDTVNRGIAIDVTREAVMFDLTNQVLSQAEKAAESLRLRKEYRVIDAVLGVTNTYKYNGTTYNTYVASGGEWVNIVASNPLVDWTDVDAALLLFGDMISQESEEPIAITGFQVLVMPAKVMTAHHLFNATELEIRTDTAAYVSHGANPLRAYPFELLPSSVYAYKRAIDGLSLSVANAKGLWYIGDFKKAFAYIENLPLTTVRANPTDYTMADHGLVFSLFADEMGVPAVKEPRYVVKCKNEA
jgi:hypothetical protein